jgi:hypothetical protein
MMGLWNKLFGRSDPSDNWQEVPDFSIALDMTRHALCDVRLGDPVEWFAKLGPPEDKEALRNGCYRYLSKGIEIGAEEGVVTDFTIVCAPDSFRPEFQPFRGSVIYAGRQFSLGPSTSETDFKQTFGEPFWRDEDDTEILLFYEYRYEIEWQVEFNLQGSLKALLIVTPPLMSGENERDNYRVTKKWPSEYT